MGGTMAIPIETKNHMIYTSQSKSRVVSSAPIPVILITVETKKMINGNIAPVTIP